MDRGRAENRVRTQDISCGWCNGYGGSRFLFPLSIFVVRSIFLDRLQNLQVLVRLLFAHFTSSYTDPNDSNMNITYNVPVFSSKIFCVSVKATTAPDDRRAYCSFSLFFSHFPSSTSEALGFRRGRAIIDPRVAGPMREA